MSEIEFPKWKPKYEDITKNIDIMEGYESPIYKITQSVVNEIVERENEYLVNYVHNIGFDIDEKELKKALEYDRNSYAEGVEYGIKLGRQQIASKLVEILNNAFNDYGVSLAEVIKESKNNE